MTSNLTPLHSLPASSPIHPNNPIHFYLSLHMTYLIAIFFPALYFLMKQKWISFIIHSVIGIIAMILIISILGAFLGLPLYFVSSICALWDLRKQLQEEQAMAIARHMHRAMQPPAPAATTSLKNAE